MNVPEDHPTFLTMLELIDEARAEGQQGSKFLVGPEAFGPATPFVSGGSAFGIPLRVVSTLDPTEVHLISFERPRLTAPPPDVLRVSEQLNRLYPTCSVAREASALLDQFAEELGKEKAGS